MTEKSKARTTRRPYQPPQLEQVELVAEEAVLQACKTPQIFGPNRDPCVGSGPDKCSTGGT